MKIRLNYFLVLFFSCKKNEKDPDNGNAYRKINTDTETKNKYLALIQHYNLDPKDEKENKELLDYMENIYNDENLNFKGLERLKELKESIKIKIKEYRILNKAKVKDFKDFYELLYNLYNCNKHNKSQTFSLFSSTLNSNDLFLKKIKEFLDTKNKLTKNKIKEPLIVLDADQKNLSTSDNFYEIIKKSEHFRIYKKNENDDEIQLRFFIKLDNKSVIKYENKLRELHLLNSRNYIVRKSKKKEELDECSKNRTKELLNMYDEFSEKIEKNYTFLKFILEKIKEKDKNFEIIKDLLFQDYLMTSCFEELSPYPMYFGYNLILKKEEKKCIIRIFYYPLSLDDGKIHHFYDTENITREDWKKKKYIEFQLN